ncbi:hypothetical protein WJX84_002079 [Apatococcus fuscideae]|uniref:Uncharacterized protein n=1 Tax=Apatococcus fuscideae TaxID=2026836 RepID=A0AAW1TGN7_9CHLO
MTASEPSAKIMLKKGKERARVDDITVTDASEELLGGQMLFPGLFDEFFDDTAVQAPVQVDDEMIFMPTAEHVTDAPLSHPRSSHRRGGMLLRADDRPLEPAHAPSPGLDPYLLL